MTLFDEIKAIEISTKKLREFGLLVGSVFVAIGGLLLWKQHDIYVYFVGIGVFLISFGAVLPNLLKPIYLFWMGLALVLGWFVSRVLLSILFYLAVTPIGIITRLMGKDFLDLQFPGQKDSYWITRSGVPEKVQIEQQF